MRSHNLNITAERFNRMSLTVETRADRPQPGIAQRRVWLTQTNAGAANDLRLLQFIPKPGKAIPIVACFLAKSKGKSECVRALGDAHVRRHIRACKFHPFWTWCQPAWQYALVAIHAKFACSRMSQTPYRRETIEGMTLLRTRVRVPRDGVLSPIWRITSITLNQGDSA